MSDIPHEIEEETTGVVSGDELRKKRATRPPEKRFEHIEDRVDEHGAHLVNQGERLGKVEVQVATLNGKMEILPRLTDTMERSIVELQKRDHQTFVQKTTVETAMTLDGIDQKKNRRERITKLFGMLGLGGGIVEVIHRLFF